MSDPSAYTRRQFLQSGLAFVSTISTVPVFLSRSSSVLAQTAGPLPSNPGIPEDRVLVVVQLSGGNDGLNTVIPFGTDSYYKQRANLAIREKEVIPIDTQTGIGLHPSLTPLHEMLGEGLAGIVQGVGYPNPIRSHFASMDVWHTGDTLSNKGEGWIGRAMDTTHGSGDTSLACIALGKEAPLATEGRRVKPVTFDRPEMFRWLGRDLHPAVSQAYDQLSQTPASDQDPSGFILRTAMDAQVASDRVRKAVQQKPATRFPSNDLAQQLKMVAAMIRAELPTRVFYVAMGGFDTHANQTGRHNRLLTEFASAISAFYNELKATGHRSRVLTVAFSEFGRRVRPNASGGTDHGTAGPMFVFGEPIRSGLIGQYPSLDDLEQGDLKYTTDFRSVYADILDNWMKIDSAAVLGRRYDPAPIIRV
ncbi:MAG: DUF1501 domain-containing protein [Phycisphaeraceae bacterium]